MGRHLADFTVLSDGQIRIGTDGTVDEDKIIAYRLRGNAIGGLKAILSFVIRNSVNLRLSVAINGQEIFKDNIPDGSFQRTIQEIFPSNVLVNRNDTITFTALRGNCIFSDAVLWYNRKS
ncbi:hypothetical protein [Polaribacter sp.]|uniref:hypothetical protein n=1 Tax=Polaribacter sp. TaxID=1920175 RepID=UPI003EF6BE5E